MSLHELFVSGANGGNLSNVLGATGGNLSHVFGSRGGNISPFLVFVDIFLSLFDIGRNFFKSLGILSAVKAVV
jgi:hypothetical protein